MRMNGETTSPLQVPILDHFQDHSESGVDTQETAFPPGNEGIGRLGVVSESAQELFKTVPS